MHVKLLQNNSVAVSGNNYMKARIYLTKEFR